MNKQNATTFYTYSQRLDLQQATTFF